MILGCIVVIKMLVGISLVRYDLFAFFFFFFPISFSSLIYDLQNLVTIFIMCIVIL